VLRRLIFVGTALLAGCPSTRPEAPKPVDDTALRIRIAQAEVRRAGGVAELLELAATKDVHARELALRGLGRSGDAKAYAALEQALVDPEPRVVAAAAAAIGVAASLDDKAMASSALVTALATAKDERTQLAIIEAIGRAGEAGAQDALVARISGLPSIAEQCALALGRFGRRKIALSDAARGALVGATRTADGRVRYAATYALGKESEPGDRPEVVAALVERLADQDAETRAQAIAALAKRKAVTPAHAALVDALKDQDWRVAVEAVHALAGATGDEDGRIAVAAMVARRTSPKALAPDGTEQVVVEALRTLLAHPVPLSIVRTTGWVDCLPLTVTHAPTAATVDTIASCKLPDHLKLPLLAELFDDKRSDAGYRRAALRILLAHDDPRVRAAGIGALPKTWADGDDRAKATIVGTVSSALAVKNPIVAGTAVDAAEALYEAMGDGNPLQTTLDNALVARATTESDVELGASLYTLIGKRKIAAGADACRTGLVAAPAAAKAAAECLRALGEARDAAPALPPPPPANVADVIGKKLVWHLTTTRGEIVIELRPDVAPWAVASIVVLTNRGFYDHLEFHRVVPDFVVQGGDPTESGWGGPGYMLPAEPGSILDGAGFVVGGVGMADAGRDSAGSQWFIMHSRAPHLDGRYTWVGSVISGQKSADALEIGDRVEKGTIEVEALSR
jgi:cyclophilin family peptidyl-prolyl cis-trans isomerase/HEAT repeat protein